MSTEELRSLARLALDEHLSPRLPQKVLELLARHAGCESGLLERGGTPMARLGDALHRPDEVPESAWELELLPGPRPWKARLCGGHAPDEDSLLSVKLALRAWELREELRTSRLGERLRLWELEAIRTLAGGIAGILDPEALGHQLITHLLMLMDVRRAELLIGGSPETRKQVVAFGDPPSKGLDLETAWSEGWTGDRVLARPVVSASGVLGLVVVADKEARTGEQPFSADDERLLELFTVQAAVALENARLYHDSLEKERLNRELAVAAEIQSYLQPREFPQIAGFAVTARRRPARFVAGDCFGVGPAVGGLEVLVADVSGKGVGAGLLAASLQAGGRLLGDLNEPLEDTAGRLNAYLYEATEDHRFATAVVVRCLEDGRCILVNAGHPPALVVRADGRQERIAATGIPLGILSQVDYGSELIRLAPGDRILLYTDGVTEAESPEGEELGVETLAELVAEVHTEGGAALCDAVLAGVERFTGGQAPGDDVTVVVIERLGA